MTLMVFLQNVHALNCKSEKQSIFKISLKSNWFFWVAVLGSVGLQILFMEVPVLNHFLSLETVPYNVLGLLIIVSFIILIIGELYKLIVRRLGKNKNS